MPCAGDLATNPNHCGYCGHDCLGGACVDGVCQYVIVVNLDNPGPTALAVDDERIYWTDSDLRAVNKDGTNMVDFAPVFSNPWGVAVDAQYVYWTEVGGQTYRIDKLGGTPQAIGPEAYRIAIDDNFVYGVWKGVRKMSKQGGNSMNLAYPGTQGIALDESYVYFTEWLPDQGGVYKVPKDGGTAEQIGVSPYSSYVAAYGDKVYWSSQGENVVYMVSKSGADQQIIAQASTPYGIAADAQGAYWAEYSAGNIWMLPTGSTTPVLLAAIPDGATRDLAIDDKAVYWTTDALTKCICKVAKP